MRHVFTVTIQAPDHLKMSAHEVWLCLEATNWNRMTIAVDRVSGTDTPDVTRRGDALVDAICDKDQT